MKGICLSIVTAVSLAACSADERASTPSVLEAPKVWPAEKMAWVDDATLQGVRSVTLWGDPAADEEHAMLRVFPAGYAPARHTHPSTERVIVVSGYLVVEHEGGEPTVLGPGSYSEIPAGMPHAVRCATEQECKFVLGAPGRFAIDFVRMD
jgi:quercetin dioxygenase-like cupin family protein